MQDKWEVLYDCLYPALDDLCNLLDCSLSEIAEHVPNEEQHGENTDNDV